MPFDRRPLRVALFTYATQPRGGVAHAVELASALHDCGHDVVVHGLDESGRGFFRTPRSPARAIRVAPRADGVVPFVRSRIAEYVAAWDPRTRPFDVYHAHDVIAGNALATLVERGAIPAFVRTVHHLENETDPTLATLQARSIRAAESVFVVGDLWRARLAERFGVAAATVPSGVDLARFVPLGPTEVARTRKRFGLTGTPVVLAIGGIEARKNTLALLEAFAELRRALPEARLVVAGGASAFDRGTYRRAFAARAETLGLELGSSVVVLGVVPDRDVPALVGAADVLAFPSLSAGFGLVVLEALACGVPVVTSDRAPFTEYLDGASAVLIEPDEPRAIAAGLREALDPATRARRIAAGRAVAAAHGWRDVARDHAARYAAIVAARAAPAAGARGPYAFA